MLGHTVVPLWILSDFLYEYLDVFLRDYYFGSNSFFFLFLTIPFRIYPYFVIIFVGFIKFVYLFFPPLFRVFFFRYCLIPMVLTSDGSCEIGADIRSNLRYLSCTRHFNRLKTVTNRIFLLRKDEYFLMRAQHVPTFISTMLIPLSF